MKVPISKCCEEEVFLRTNVYDIAELVCSNCGKNTTIKKYVGEGG